MDLVFSKCQCGAQGAGRSRRRERKRKRKKHKFGGDALRIREKGEWEIKFERNKVKN